MTQTTTTASAPATPHFEDELEFAIGALRDEGGIELVAIDGGELMAGTEDSAVTAQHLREVARLFDRHAVIVGQAAPSANWSEMSHFAKFMSLARNCDSDVRAKLEEVADELRIQSMADAEMEAYRDGNISRETLVMRLEELAGRESGILEWLRSHDRYGRAWHDDSAEIF